MQVESRSFWFPKRGNTAAEYEDAFVPPSTQGESVVAAVADGATETIYAGLWARLLVERFRRSPCFEPAALPAWLAPVRRAWHEHVGDEAAGRSWYVSTKLEETGAAAAVLGLAWFRDHSWRALCAGDCCLFHLRGGTLVKAWPFEEARQLGYRPELLVSSPHASAPAVEIAAGEWQEGDVFLLATDAVAGMLLDQADYGPVAQASDQEIEERLLRISRDDVTLLIITLS